MNQRFAKRTVDFCRDMGYETLLFDLDGHPEYEGITQTVLVRGKINDIEVKKILDARFANARISEEDQDTIPDGVECIWVPDGVYFI